MEQKVTGPEQDMSMTDESPMDSIISRVKGYISDPSTVTRETLNELLADLEDLKSFVEGGDETQDNEPVDTSNDNTDPPSLHISLGRMRKNSKGGQYE